MSDFIATEFVEPQSFVARLISKPPV